jgi:hypothetical protein
MTEMESGEYVERGLAPLPFYHERKIAGEILRIKETGGTRVANTWKMRRLALRKR